MYKKQLQSYSVSEEKFDEILNYGYKIKKVVDAKEFNKYKFGYKEITMIVYDGFKTMIVSECILNDHVTTTQDPTYWKQCIVHKDIAQSAPCTLDINGSTAYKVIKSLITNYYTEEEYKEILGMYEAEEDEKYSQYHYQLYEEMNKIIRYDNCYKWDINGAHNDAICEMFPRAANSIRHLYNTRKQHPENKKYINYYVGMLVPRGYRKTYNWIVQRTTKILFEGIERAGGLLLYANTDGFIVQNPDVLLTHSNKLGDFKLEYQGSIWTYYDKNYQCYQLSNKEITGSVLYSVRDKIDLPNNVVVHYDRIRCGDTYIAENVKVEEIKNGL